MARVETIVVGGGINPGTPFALQGIPFVSAITPPLLQTTPLFFHVAGPPEAIVVSSTGADPAAGASVSLRVRGNIANYDAGTNNRSYGDGHTVDPTPTGYFIAGRANTIASTAGGNCILVGTTVSASSTQCVMYGQSLTVGTGYNAAVMTLIGASLTVGNGGGGVSGDLTVIGGAVTISGGVNFDTVVIASNVAIGAAIGRSVLIGNSDGAGSVGASTDSNVIIGYRFIVAASKSNSISLGSSNTISHNSCILLGGALSTTADNQCWIGGALFSGFINTVIIGSGDTNGTQHSVTVRLTNGTGTDNAGNNLTIQPGISTGNAAAGQFIIATGDVVAGSSGTLQTVTNKMIIVGVTTDQIFRFQAPGTRNLLIELFQATVQQCIIGVAGAAGGIVTGSAANETVVRTETQRLLFTTDGGTSICSTFTTAGVQTWEKDRGLRFNNQTDAAGAGAGTLGNAPAAGNPTFWWKVNINGTNRAIPCWAG
jgi:hypothetical protein